MDKNRVNEIQIKLYVKLYSFLTDSRGDMAEKAIVMALIILVAYAAFRLLGGNISDLVTRIANLVGGS
jgi:hypothetical protein